MKKKIRKNTRRNLMKTFVHYVGQIVKTRFDTVNRF